MVKVAVQCKAVNVRKAALYAGNRFSRDHVHPVLVEHPERVRRLEAAVLVISVGDRIPPALRAAALDNAQEWAAPQACLLRECRAVSRQAAPARLHAGPDNAISMGQKKAQ